MKNKFRRRYWNDARRMWADLSWPFQHRKALRQAMRDENISLAFRERLMLAVTQVNACRYCSQYHAHVALQAGLSANETRAMLEGDLQTAPAAELPALLYAQHWAEMEGLVEPDIRHRLVEKYGSEEAADIETVLKMIRIGNMAGNTADYWLYRLSFGRLGLLENERSNIALSDPN